VWRARCPRPTARRRSAVASTWIALLAAGCSTVDSGSTEDASARGGSSGSEDSSGGGGSNGDALGATDASASDGGAPDGAAPSEDATVDGSVAAKDASAPESDVGADSSGDDGGSAGDGGPVSHRFLNGFSDKGMLAIVNPDGTHAWDYTIAQAEANDAWLLPNGDVVLAFIAGAREVTPAKQTVWQYMAPAGAEVHSVQPLPGGLFLIGESHSDGTSFLYEMDKTTTISHTVKVTLGGGSHGQFREVRKTPQGTYITSQLNGKAMEWDANGALLNTYPCGSFVGIRLPDGNTLISCGDDHRLIEVNPQNAIVWQVGQNDIPGNTLFFVAGLQRLPNGNTVVCNWPGHVGGSAQPQVFEITRDKKVVWQVRDASLGWISNIEILDPAATFNGTPLR
jgi:hypothetical protein